MGRAPGSNEKWPPLRCWTEGKVPGATKIDATCDLIQPPSLNGERLRRQVGLSGK